MDMEGNRNQNISTASLCRAGCGFYGNQAFDGMCSKCYKDAVKRKQNAPVTSGRSTPSQVDCGSSSTVVTDDVTAPALTPPETTPSVETATPTVPVATPPSNNDNLVVGSASIVEKSEDGATGGSAAVNADGSPGGSDKKPKKNRCSTCKKKVGLTGFECRCGGLYCSLHRYSDKHDCQFDYKEMAQEQIRRNNPVVVGAKIQKL